MEGDPFEAMLPPVGLEEVGEDHRVRLDAAQVDALPAEDDEVVFDVLARLLDGRVFKDFLEDAQGLLDGDLGRDAEVIVPERDVESLPGRHGERHPDEPGFCRERAVGLRVEGEAPGLLQSGGQGLELFFVEDGRVFPGPLGGVLDELGQERREFQLLEDAGGLGGVGLARGEILKVEGEVEPPLDGHELAAELERIEVLLDLLPDLGVADPARVGKEAFQGPELVDERPGRLLADARDAGDIVRLVPLERQDVGHPGRLDPEELLDARLVEGDLLGGVVHGGFRVDDLEEVLVRRDDDGMDAPAARDPGQAGQDVVGLVIRGLVEGDPEGGDELLEDRDLDHEVLGHGLPVGLVVLEGLMAERRPLGVEDDPEIIGLFGPHELPQGAQEAVNGVGGEALGVREPPDGVIGPVKEGIPVDEEEPLPRPRRRGHFVPVAPAEEAVVLAVGDLLDDGLVLVLHHLGDHLFEVRAVEEGGVEGLFGRQELARPVDQGFHVMGAQALVLGLDMELAPLVIEPGIEAAGHMSHPPLIIHAGARSSSARAA